MLILAVKYVASKVILCDMLSLTALTVRLFGDYVLTRSSLSGEDYGTKLICGIAFLNGYIRKNWLKFGCMWCGCCGITGTNVYTDCYAEFHMILHVLHLECKMTFCSFQV